MRNLSNHPDRIRMLKAIKSGKVPFALHLKQCESCRILYDLLASHGAAASPKLERPSRAAVRQSALIPKLVQSRKPARAVPGRVEFDSWAQLPAMQIRQAPSDLERRLRLTAQGYTLELVADRKGRNWEFVARVYNKEQVCTEFILQVGRLKLGPEAHDCYFWTAAKPPRRLQLLSPALKLDFGEISW